MHNSPLPKSRSTEFPPPAPIAEDVPQDDRIIARVFWISALVIVLIALLVGAVMVYYKQSAPAEPVSEAEIVGPRESTVAARNEPPLVPFVNFNAEGGIRFSHVNGAYGERLLPETMGGGVAFLDYDNDDDQDILFVNSAAWPWQPPATGGERTAALYRNRGDGTFDDVTRGSGLDFPFYGMGAAVGDYDGDGFVDVFLTAVGRNRLLRNDGGKRFVDVTASANVAGADVDWSTGATFFDFDRDGDLDLFVCNYVRWSRDIDLKVDYRLAGIGRAYGPPTNYAGAHPYLYRNEGGGKFIDVTRAAGMEINHPATGLPVAKALSVMPFDADHDGWPDLAIANDTVRNFLFRNLGDGRFEEIGVAAGIAFNNDGAATGAMGMDVKRDHEGGRSTLAIGNFANEMTSFYVAQTGALFTDEAVVSGIGPASRQALSFGLFFFDYDLDGRLDLLQANGHLEQEINSVQSSQHYRQPAQLFWNCGPDCPRQYTAVPRDKLGALGTPLVGRGAAYADIDGDGDLDMVITQAGGEATLLRNDQTLGHHWLRIKLIDNGRNTSAIGAALTLHTGERVQYRQVMPTRSYLSQVELPVTFGLGRETAIDKLVIRWPDGSIEERGELAVDKLHVIRRGEI